MAIDDDEETESMTIFPAGTHFVEPDAIHRVTITFPDQDSAIAFFEWCRQKCIDAELDD
jgi:hypothetical protein